LFSVGLLLIACNKNKTVQIKLIQQMDDEEKSNFPDYQHNGNQKKFKDFFQKNVAAL
jgi:hypothetical protein